MSSGSVSTNSGDFHAFLGCRIFLTFFSAFVVVFFPSGDAFLGFCSSWLGPSMVSDNFLGLSDLDSTLGCKTFPLVTLFVKFNDLHYVRMIFLISLQCLFMSLFLSLLKFFLFFHFILTGFNLFPSLQYD